jgi:hypothetical protein
MDRIIKTTPPFLLCRGNVFTALLPSNDGYTDRPTETRVQKLFYSYVYSLPREYVYPAVAKQLKEGYTLPSLCLVTVGGIHIQTHRWQGFMKYAVEIGSGAMIYIPSFIKIGSGIQKLIRWREIHRYIDTQTAWRYH